MSKKNIPLIVFAFLFSCESVQKETEKPLNPNGDSELALLMREVFEQTALIRDNINNPDFEIPQDYVENLKKFHSATPTEPDMKLASYDGFAKAINMAADSLSKNKSPEAYKQLVNACISCHKEHCSGPIPKIKKLNLR